MRFTSPPLINRRGMTLIELLIAIVGIALIVALSVPLLGKMREQGQVVKCLANMKQLGVAAFAYAADNQGLLPRGDAPRTGQPDVLIQWPYVLERYVGVNYLSLLANPQSFRASVFSCPAESAAPTYNYALNRQLNQRLYGDEAYVRIARVRNPSRYVLFSDAYHDRTIFTDLRSKMLNMTRLTRRHGGTPNFLYADGHVAPYTGPIYGVSDAEGRSDPAIRALWEYNYQLP